MTLAAKVTFSESFFDGNVLASDPSIYTDGDAYVMLYTDLDPFTGNTIISMARSDNGQDWSLAETSKSSPGAVLLGSEVGIENFEAAAAYTTGSTSMIMASGYSNHSTLQKGFPAICTSLVMKTVKTSNR